jgi:hypothetical protein
MLFYSGYNNNILKQLQFLVNNWNTSFFTSNLFHHPPPPKFRGRKQKPALFVAGRCLQNMSNTTPLEDFN